MARSRIYTLLARYATEGEAAFEPRSRRPLSSPAAIPGATVELIVRLRKELAGQGLDAGPHTIGWHPLARWRVWLDATGVVRRLALEPDQARLLLAQVTAVLQRLPSPGVPIGRLAAECCGDAHALDDGRPVGTLVLSAAVRWRACRSRRREAPTPAARRGPPPAFTSTSCRRWCSASACPATPARPWAGCWRRAARRASRGCLRSASSAAMASRCAAARVWICENPVVIAAAADELGAGCQPLVCVGGQPSAAGWRLLELLAAGGAESGYHGDFDWGGVRIACTVRHRVNWRPWRYDHQEYETAVSAAHSLASLAGLVGEPAATPWDPELAAGMRRRNHRIEENSPSMPCSRTLVLNADHLDWVRSGSDLATARRLIPHPKPAAVHSQPPAGACWYQNPVPMWYS